VRLGVCAAFLLSPTSDPCSDQAKMDSRIHSLRSMTRHAAWAPVQKLKPYARNQIQVESTAAGPILVLVHRITRGARVAVGLCLRSVVLVSLSVSLSVSVSGGTPYSIVSGYGKSWPLFT
jgi:hypothetical protein